MTKDPQWLDGAQLQSASTITRAPSRTRDSTAPVKVKASYVTDLGKTGYIEPKKWEFDNSTHREPVIDIDCDPPRIVRRVGWLACMCCGKAHFSQDVIKIRLCYTCKYSLDSTVCEKSTDKV